MPPYRRAMLGAATLAAFLALPVDAAEPKFTPGCRAQAQGFLQPFNDSGTVCANELITMFAQNNSLGFSEIHVRCIGNAGLQTCYGLNDPQATTNIVVTDTVDDCALCSTPPWNNRTGCQSLLDLLIHNVSSEASSPHSRCTVPAGDDRGSIFSDLSQLVLLRFQLDIKCSGVSFASPDVNGEMSTLKTLTQCQCGATVCPPGVYCAANKPAVYCPEGYYCPDFGGDKIKCQEGHWCPEGSTEELACKPGAVCDEGSARQYEFLPFFFTLLLAPACWFALRHFYGGWEEARKEEEDDEESEGEMESIMGNPNNNNNNVNKDNDKAIDKDKDDGDNDKNNDSNHGTAAGEPRAQAFETTPAPKAEEGVTVVEVNVASKGQANGVAEGGSSRNAAKSAKEVHHDDSFDDRFELSIEFVDLGLRVPVPKSGCCGCGKPDQRMITADDEGMVTRLDSITGALTAGTLTAVMGPSGSGKSTFLNTVCGKLEATHGEVKVNGREAKLTEFKRRIGFVPQNDIVESKMRVREALEFSAHIRLNKSPEERTAIVNQTMKSLGLWHVRDSVIGDEYQRGVSGGEKKRVNIGVELVAEPSALFLDEPTTGLDATAALGVTRILRKLASEYKMTICAVVHQPRPLMVKNFDNLLLLLRGGRMAWFGSASGAMAFFKQLGYRCPPGCDFPDFFSDVISGMASRNPDNTEDIYETDSKARDENIAYLAKMCKLRSQQRLVSGGSTLVNPKSSLGEGGDSLPSFARGSTIEPHTIVPKGHGVDVDVNDNAVSFCVQFTSYVRRGFLLRCIRTNRLMIDCLAYFAGALIIGMVFSGEILLTAMPDVIYGSTCPATSEDSCFRPSNVAAGRYGFYNTMCLGIVAGAVATSTFGGRRKILFWREASSGASHLAYFLGENLCDLCTVWLYTLIYTSVMQLIVPLRGPFEWWWLLWTMCAITVKALAYVYSLGIAELSNALITTIVSAVVLALFLGYVGGIGTFAQWTYAMWVGRAASNIEFNIGYGVNTTIPTRCRENPEFGNPQNCFKDSETDEQVSFYDFLVPDSHRDPDIALDFGVLIAMAVLIRVIAYVILVLKDKDKKR